MWRSMQAVIVVVVRWDSFLWECVCNLVIWETFGREEEGEGLRRYRVCREEDEEWKWVERD